MGLLRELQCVACQPHSKVAIAQMTFKGDDSNPAKRPAQRLAMSLRRKGLKESAGTKNKKRLAMKKLLRRKAMKEKWSSAQKGRRLTNEVKQRIRLTKKRRVKKLSTLIHDMDSAFSIYIRTKYADVHGYVQCFT